MRIALLILLSVGLAHAGGLSADLDAYAELVDARRALGDVPGARTSPRYAELCRLEAAARAPLAHVAAGADDLADIVRREMARRLGALDDAAAVAAEARPLEAIAGPDGALMRVAPLHDAAAAGVLAPFARLRVTGRAGEWYQLIAPDGVRVFAHGSLLDVDLEEGDVPAGYTRIADQKPTYYNTTREAGFPTSGPLFGQNYNGTEKRQIRTVSGALIANTSGRYFASLVMEGSGILSDGRGVSFVKNNRFQVLPAGCKGMTATGKWVVPFHTLAVNRREMPYHGVYFVPRTKGLVMPNGEVHDGFWFAHDTGGAFQGTPKHRTDMYTDEAAWVTWMELNHAPSFSPIRFYRVDPATAKLVYEKYQHLLGP